MEAAQMITKNYSLRVLKEPRGFIKFIEFVLAIFAFATTAGHCDWFSFTISCNPDFPAQKVKYCYPFNMNQVAINVPMCTTVSTQSMTPLPAGTVTLKVDPSSSAEYFVAVGVLAFLYCLAALVWYVFFEKNHRDKDMVPIIDFLVTCAFVLLWLTASSAWAKGVTDVKHATNFDNIKEDLIECQHYDCNLEKNPSYATLNVSIVFGFLNMFVWGGNVWFVYKETGWFDKYTQSKTETPKAADTSSTDPAVVPDNQI
ncbi:synaptophysin-like [Ptychodera flava]|uniref:synaptophysin-like n=1 Tax=Ptychodera flava TaxID=63121 RepID=UPI00396A408B